MWLARQPEGNRHKADPERWISTPGKGGRKHVDNSVRVFSAEDDEYLGSWGLLGL